MIFMKTILKIFGGLILITAIALAIGELAPVEDFKFENRLTVPEYRVDDNTPENVDFNTYPSITGLDELREFVIDHRESGITEFSFIDAIDEQWEPLSLGEIYGSSYVSWRQQGSIYHITMTERPAVRIVDAYISDDDSQLSRDEKRVLEKAVEMVEEARKEAETDWELELLLYEKVCGEVTYFTEKTWDSSEENRPRFVSVIGAFLDGKANCQGYSEAFYTLARIAGFEVGFLSVDTDSPEGHMANTINIDGKWYVVDTTFGDSEEGFIDFRLFNAGRDLIGEYWWDEELEPYPVAETTDEELYYYFRNELVYEDIDEMASAVAKQWNSTGELMFHVMLMDETDGEKFNDVLYEELKTLNRAFSYRIWYHNNGTDTFYCVVFN